MAHSVMRYDPERHHRRSIRLRDYDYSRAGAYFVTIGSWNREGLFGEIVDSVGARHAVPLQRAFGQPIPRSLPTIIGSFKSATTKRINALRRTPGMPVWQRNYYERVIRNDGELDRIRHYIAENPARWAEDSENPANW